MQRMTETTLEQVAPEQQPPEEPKAKHTISQLEALYQGDEEVDKELFAEQRSNLLLYSGDHYNKLKSSFYKRVRDSKSLSEEQKLRLTKNHTQKIVDAYTNHIMSTAPGVGFSPANKAELQDQKAAEMNKGVWESAKQRLGFDETIQDWAEDFTQIGEVATLLSFDPMAGPFLGMEQGEDGKMTPKFKGDLVPKTVFGFNLIIDSTATDHRTAKRMTIREMVPCADLKKMFPGEENERHIQESADQTYVIFDRGKSGYQKTKDQCLLRKMYFRPCYEYPNGYVYYFVKEKILFESELPAGKFPIIFKPFRKLKTKARGQAIIKTIRPFQAEINRAASKIAEHQITLGDDKVLIQNGTQLTNGRVLAGIRSFNYTGMKPEVLQGRDGSQYTATLTQNITEMYNAVDVDEREEPMSGQIDPMALIYRSGKQKKKFKLYVSRFEQFLVEFAQLYLELARYYFSDEDIVAMCGKNEQVNVEEFRQMDPLCYKIKVEAQAEDLETKMGKQMVLSQALQYTSAQLGKEDIGKIMKMMPYSNLDETFSDLTIDYEAATNDILALDRGQRPAISEFDNHVYMIKRLTQRMRQADFEYMDDMIRINYLERLDAHQEIQARQLKAIQDAKNELIPTTGYLVSTDFYIQVPNSTGGTKDQKVRVPSGALTWLIERMEGQGQTLEAMEKMNQENLAQIAGKAGSSAEGGQDRSPSIPSTEMDKGLVNGSANGIAIGSNPLPQ